MERITKVVMQAEAQEIELKRRALVAYEENVQMCVLLCKKRGDEESSLSEGMCLLAMVWKNRSIAGMLLIQIFVIGIRIRG